MLYIIVLHNSSGKSDYHCIEFVLDNKFQQHPLVNNNYYKPVLDNFNRLGKNCIGTIVLNFEINIIRI